MGKRVRRCGLHIRVLIGSESRKAELREFVCAPGSARQVTKEVKAAETGKAQGLKVGDPGQASIEDDAQETGFVNRW